MELVPTVSVIIPTYNRKVMLRETLISLADQTYPNDRFEVIVVDDGSTDGTREIETQAFPFILRYFFQENQGDAAARNLGAGESQADILVFLDDDILVEPGYLSCLIDSNDLCKNRIVVGICNLWLSETAPFSQTMNSSLASDDTQKMIEVSFKDIFSNNMSLRREAYFKIGMMQGLDFPGSDMWCDLDFAYRAYLQAFEFYCSTQAICWHRDHNARNQDDYKNREKTAAYRAVVLFQKYPELPAHLPMFFDKTPIIWGQDPPRLIARKLARSLISSRLVLSSMERIVIALGKNHQASAILHSLNRYIIGGYIFQGYREGLREFERRKHKNDAISKIN